jgi:poly-gamma-glutamate synthesis protein (capsule biosynthesis protein)
MNKIKIFIIVLFVLIVTIFAYWHFSNKNKIAGNNYLKNNNVSIYVDAILSKDINKRLNNFSENNLLKPTDNIESDICVSMDSQKCPQSVKENIFSESLSWLPDDFAKVFDSKIPDISITYTKTNNSNDIFNNTSDYLKKSYIENNPTKTTLIFTGDILPTRWVSKRAHDNNDMSYPFREIYNTTQNADYTIADLECPFAETGPYQELGIVFRGDPELVEGLKLAGIDTVNLANNHLGDSQQAGMKFTFNLLYKNNIGFFGAGINQTEAHKAYIKEVNGVKIALIGYADQDFTPISYEADDKYAGLNLMNIAKMQEDVAMAKKEADFVIVSMHAGTEYTHDPDIDQVEFAHSALDAGADMVYGHHPHVVQGIEVYKNKPIFYSLGNLAMDQIDEDTRQGFILEIKLVYNKISDIKLMPYHIYDWSQPKLVEGSEYQKILDDVITSSQKLQLQ